MQQHSPRWVVSLLFICMAGCHSNNFELQEVKQLTSYPSGSAIAFFEDRIYLAGDDVPYMLVLDQSFNVVDSIRITADTSQRIEKDTKPDYEAIASIRYNRKPALLLLGSGSKDPYRNNALIVDGKDSAIRFKLDSFYAKLRQQHLKDLNVEGAAAIPGGLLLSSRGNKGFRKNYLVFASSSFYQSKDSSPVRLIKVGTNPDTSVFNGVSGLEYARKSDKLLLTVSTENTYDSYADGSIGKSYLWIINDITTRRRFSNINPDTILDLGQLDARFKGHKIESVCIIDESRTHLLLVFAADNDKGDTWLFKVRLRK